MTPTTPMMIPPTTPLNPRIIPDDKPITGLAPLFNRLVSTTAPDPPPELEAAAKDAAKLPVADAAGESGTMVLVGADTPFREAATLKGAFPLES